MGVGNRIRIAIGSKYPLLKDFCEAVGISDRTLHHYLSEKRGVSTDFLTTLTEHIGVSASWVLTGKGSMFISDDEQNGHADQANFVPIPRYEVEAAAGDSSLVDDETQTGFYAFNRSWLDRRRLSPDQLAVISVRGDSMTPLLTEGDLILVDQSQKEILDGVTYVVRLGNDLLVKYVQRISPDAISLLSENRRYPPREITIADMDDQAAIVGRVVASMHEWI